MKDAKISNVEVYLVERAVKGNFADSTRNVETIGYAVTVVTLDNGLYGVGLTYHEVGGEAIREFVLRALKPKLLGRSPFETEAIWEECFHYIRGVGRKGLAFCAYSSVDIALWDLKGQLLDMPLYKLLGGTKKKIPIYASGGWTSYSCEELVEEAREMVRRGYTMIKLKVGVEGGRNPNEDVRRIQAVRDAIGPDIGLMPTSGAPPQPFRWPTACGIWTSCSWKSLSLPTTSRAWPSSSGVLTFPWPRGNMNTPSLASGI